MKDTYKPRWQLRYTYRLIQIDGWIDRWIDPYIDPYIHRMDRQNCKIVRRICKTWVHSGCSYTLLAAKICANSISFAVNIGKYPVNRLDQWSYRLSRHRVRSNGDISEIQTIPHKDNYCALGSGSWILQNPSLKKVSAAIDHCRISRYRQISSGFKARLL